MIAQPPLLILAARKSARCDRLPVPVPIALPVGLDDRKQVDVLRSRAGMLARPTLGSQLSLMIKLFTSHGAELYVPTKAVEARVLADKVDNEVRQGRQILQVLPEDSGEIGTVSRENG